MQDERVHEQIQRLIDARDQKAFSRLLIDSVCSMPSDDFHRVREKLIRKFIDDQRSAASSSNGQMTATIKTDTQLDGRTPTEENMMGCMTASDDANSSALSLRIVNVRSCSVEETDGSWMNDAEPQSSVNNQLTVKQEQLDSSSWHGGHFTDRVSVDDNNNEDVTTTNYITIAPIETTNIDDTATEFRYDDQTQRQYMDVNDIQPISTVCHRQPGQVSDI